MKTLLILVRGDARTFYDLQQKSILSQLPCRCVLLVDRGNRAQFESLPGAEILETVRWKDDEQLKQQVLQLHQQYQFDGVTTLDESNVELAAELRQLLGLAGMQPEQASWFRNKVRMKQQLMAAGIRVPQFVSCSETQTVRRLLQHYGRLVIKPVDGLGSKQVVFITREDELALWEQQHMSELEEFEAEEFIEGDLYHVNALVIDGIAQLTAAAAYLPGMSNIEFSSGAPFVSVIVENEELKQRLIAHSNEVNQALQLLQGVTHLECFVTPKGEIVFVEVGLRPGGGGIVWMIESQFGINYNFAALALAAEQPELIPTPSSKPQHLAGLIGIRSHLSGFVVSSAAPQDFAKSNIQLRQIDVSAGKFSAAAAHCTDFQGLFIFDSVDGDDFDQNWREIYHTFNQKLQLNCI